MHADIVDLNEFYGSRLGQTARRLLRRRIREVWPNVRGLSVLGVGFATPFLRPFLDEAERVIGIMPAAQGVTAWPRDGANRVALGEETELPLPDLSVDRVLLAHALEATDNMGGLMREVWRVLRPGGRLLAVVPNRRGIWARTDRTPFGNGHPYSASQLSRLLRQHLFVPERVARSLYMPPVSSRFLLRAAPAWEEIGARWFEGFSGVLMVDSTKQLYQPTRSRPLRRRPVLVPVGLPARGAVARHGPRPAGVATTP